MPVKSATRNGAALTLAALAKAKAIPVDYLHSLGLHDVAGGVGIPYHGPTGEEGPVKRRTSIIAKEGSFWPKGQPVQAYGQWRLDAAAKAGFLLLVEGESDCWALWYHGLPAVGVPGANNAKVLTAEQLNGVATIYCHREPDKRGEIFVAGVAARLVQLGWQGKAWELRLPAGVKDPADLHVGDAKGFKATLQRAIETSAPIPLGNASANGSAKPAPPTFPDPIPASQLAAGGAAADWLWRGYLARGSVTLLTSLWKAGKSTLLAHLVKAMESGDDLADLPVSPGNVLVVSEESAALWAGRRDKLVIGDHALFHIRPFLGRPDALAWRAFVGHLAGLVRQRDLALVCFDTLAALSPCDDENDAAKMMAALLPLHELTEAGAAVLLNHHPRKGDAGEGQASRGSGALPGFVDVILEMRRPRGAERECRRRELTAYSRFDDTPAELVIELREDGSGYRSLGNPAEADRQTRLAAISDLLPGDAPGRTAEEVMDAWPDDGRKPGKRTLELDLKHGAEAGRWSMAGAGKRGDPFRFWRNGNSIRAPIDPISARNEMGGQTNGTASGPKRKRRGGTL